MADSQRSQTHADVEAVDRILWRRYAPLAVMLIGLGAWSARLEARDGQAQRELLAKADTALVNAQYRELRAELGQIHNIVNDIAARQRQQFCRGAPEWCR